MTFFIRLIWSLQKSLQSIKCSLQMWYQFSDMAFASIQYVLLLWKQKFMNNIFLYKGVGGDQLINCKRMI